MKTEAGDGLKAGLSAPARKVLSYVQDFLYVIGGETVGASGVRPIGNPASFLALLDIPKVFAGLSKEMEISIFRVVQECLTNIHRHAGSSTAGIRITQDEACLRVEIEDAGKGIPPEKEAAIESSAHAGVGLRGMRERLRRLGGTLHIRSSGGGTRVIAILPVPHATSAPAAQEVPKVALT